MKKKVIALLALLVICLSIIAAGTLAYYTNSVDDYSILSTGNVEIAFSDSNSDSEATLEREYAVLPGTSVDNSPVVYNVGPGSAWVRLKVEAYIIVNGQPQKLDADLVTMDYDTDNWVNDGEYWYYTSVLDGKTDTDTPSTSPLFTSISFSPTMGNDYQGSTLQITVQAQAVQSRNNADSVIDAVGWPG